MQTISAVPFEDNFRDEKLEASLLSLSYVKECIACWKAPLSGHKSLLVAYIVTTQPVASADLDKQLEGVVNPDAYVFINALPLTDEGEVDYDTLFTLPVFDKETKEKIQLSIQSLAQVSQARIEEDYIEAPKEKASSASSSTSKPQVKSGAVVSHSDKPAISHGEKVDESLLVTSIDKYLIEAAKDQAKGIHFTQGDGSSAFVSYESLYLDAQKVASGLQAAGCESKDVVVLAVDDQELFLKLFWGATLSNVTVLPMAALTNDDPESAPVKKLLAVLETLPNPRVIVEDKNISILNAVLPGSFLESVISAERLAQNQSIGNFPPVSAEDTALLLLTSGSTGTPKIVTQNHEALIHRSHASAVMNKFESNDVFLNWFPLDHVGGIVMFHLQALSVGASQVLSPMGRILNKPLEWLDLIERHEATVTWAPNFAYALVNEALKGDKDSRWNLSSMRFILNGGEAINAEQAHLFLKNLESHGLSPNCMHPSWGMSETCSGVAFTDSVNAQNFDGAEAVVIGQAIPGISFRIVDESGELVKEGQIGDLQIQGKPVTQEYFGNPEANEASFTSDGWFITGDRAAMLDEKIAITGREKDVIIINGLNHSCAEIEAHVEEIKGVKVSHTAAVGVRDSRSTTDKLAVFFVPAETDDVSEVIRKVRKSVAETFNVRPDYVVPLQAEDLPRTSIGKIQRSLLKVGFEEGKYNRTLRLLDENTYLNRDSFQAVWRPKVLFSPVKKDQAVLVLTSSKEFAPKEQDVHVVYWDSAKSAQDQLLELEKVINQQSINAVADLRSFDSQLPQVKSVADVEKIQTQHTTDLVELLKILNDKPSVQSFVCCSNYSQFVSKDDTVVPAKSGLAGIVKAVNFENPNLQAKHMDLGESMDLHLVLDEFQDSNKDTEVAYRDGVRYGRSLSHFITNPVVQANPIQDGGFYVITGGLGGIGFELAKKLLKEHEARVLLIGRTQMPARHLWQQYLEDGLEEATKIKNFKQLQGLGKDRVIYASGDLCDEAFVEDTLKQACEFYQDSPKGIFHLAGRFEEKSIQTCDQDHLQRVLNAKTLGAWNLLQSAVKFEKDMDFVTFSSANGYFAGPNLAAYSSANIFLEQLANQSHDHIHHHCFAWSMWDDLGMSENYSGKELTKIRGYRILNPKEAIECLFDGMTQDTHNLIVGIDGHNSYMQCHIGQPSHNLKEVKVTYSSAQAQPVEKLTAANSNIVDSFGHEIKVRFENQTTDAAGSNADSSVDITGTLTEIWEQVLDLDDIDPDDNFFDLGGHSLVLIKVQESLREKLNMDIEMVELFKYPTIRTLSQNLSEQVKPQVNVEEALTSIWVDVLEFDDISPDSNFFDLGGHSMIMIKVHERIKSELNVDVEIIDLFKYPTLKALSEFVEDKVN